ncbi:TetR/AcrR family transcriptional regulator [Streptomyces sp. NBC_01617]|uniref:TetR/AcrR family transcriptional regulator n=1 Tax=Streptomyces sp. NBC_01617 TaxID=2975899 RepID=UPI003870AB36
MRRCTRRIRGGRRGGLRSRVLQAESTLRGRRKEFSEQGYGATSIRDIAQRAGVSLSALYYYKGRQELLVAILDEGLDAYFDARDEALESAGDDPAERLEAIVAATVRFRTGHPVMSSIVLTEGRSLEAEYLERYRRNEERASQQFRDIIDKGVEEGVFLTPYPDDVSLALTVVEYRPCAPDDEV